MLKLKHSQIPSRILLKNLTKKNSQECLKYKNINNDKSKKFLRYIFLNNPILFGDILIRPFIRNWDTPPADHHYIMVENVLRNKSNVIHVPVEHAKSTWFSLVLPLWLLCRDKNCQGSIISNTARQAQGFLSVIKTQIKENNLLHEYFPHIKPDYESGWSKSQIFVKRDKDKQSKDPSILAIGTGGAILGARLDWVIADDILDLSNTMTELLRKGVSDWWYETVDSRVLEDGLKIVIGTLQHRKDLLCELSDKKSYCYTHLKAYDEYRKVSLWDKKWSVERLMDKKDDIGTIRWNKVYQNDRSISMGKLFSPDWINYYGINHKMELPKFNFNVLIGFDPAITDDKQTAEERQQDECGLAVIYYDKENKIFFLIETHKEHLTFPQQLKLIEDYYKKYKEKGSVRIGIEQTYYQKALKQQLFVNHLPVLGVDVGNVSKAVRLEGFAVHVETKRFFVKENHDDFIDEFIEYEPGGKSPNILDACNTAVQLVKSDGMNVTEKEKKIIQNMKLR